MRQASDQKKYRCFHSRLRVTSRTDEVVLSAVVGNRRTAAGQLPSREYVVVDAHAGDEEAKSDDLD